MSPRLHTDFIEIQAHTAKCDLCEKHNKLTLYRCTECGQQTCSVCWNKLSGDGIHLFNGEVAGGPDLNAYPAVIDERTGGERDDESQGRTRNRKRGRVITDDEDDDSPMLKRARARENPEARGASKHQGKRTKVNMSSDDHEDHENGLPTLWPMLPAKRLAVLRPAVSAASTTAHESSNRETQRNSHLQGQEPRRDQQRMAQAHDGIERQAALTRHLFIDGQQTTRQARHQTLPNGPHQQTSHPAYLNAQYHPRHRTDVEQQAARNLHAFTNNQPTNRQAPRPTQPRIAQQQATQVAPPYRPPPGVDMDRQAARNQLAFAPRPQINHQALPPAQASIPQQHAHNAAHMAQIAARNQQAFRLNQEAQQYANEEQMESRNSQVLISHQRSRPVVNGQIAARDHQVPDLNCLSPASAVHRVEMLAARDAQRVYQVYLSNQFGPAHSSASHGSPSPQSWTSHGSSSPLPAQDFVSAQSTAPPAPRQFQHRVTIQDLLNEPSENVQFRKRSPELLEAADVPLSHIQVEQFPRSRSHSDQDANGISQLLNAAGQPGQAHSANFESGSSSKILAAESEAAGIKLSGPHGFSLSTDAYTAKTRIEQDRTRLDGLHSSSATADSVADLTVSPLGHANYGHTSLEPELGPVRAGSSDAHSHISTPSVGQSHPGPKLPMSDHAATYINQWNSGRAALPSRSRSSTADVPPAQLRSPVLALHPRSNTGVQDVQDTVAAGPKGGEAAEVSSPSVNSAASATEDPNGIDAVMSDTDVEIHEDEESRRHKASAANNNPWTIGMAKGAEKARARAPEPIPELRSDGRAEKHQRGEEEGDGKPSNEQKVSGDIDVVDANGRKEGKENLSEKIDDDGGSDIEITSWKSLNSNKSSGRIQGTKARAKESRTVKKGVAQVKNPERKGRKAKATAARVG